MRDKGFMSAQEQEKLKNVKRKKQQELEAKLQEIKSRISMATSREEIARLIDGLADIIATAHDFDISIYGVDSIERDLADKEVAFSLVGDLPTSHDDGLNINLMFNDDLPFDEFSHALAVYEDFRAKKRKDLEEALSQISEPAVIIAEELMAAVIVTDEERLHRAELKRAQEKRDKEFQDLHTGDIDFNKKIEATEKEIADLRHQQRLTDDRKAQIALQAEIRAKQEDLAALQKLQESHGKKLLSKKALEKHEKPRVDAIMAEDRERHKVLEHQVAAREKVGKDVEGLKEHREVLSSLGLVEGPSDQRVALEEQSRELAAALAAKRQREAAITALQSRVRAKVARIRVAKLREAKSKASNSGVVSDQDNAHHHSGEKVGDWSKKLDHQMKAKLGALSPPSTPSVSGKGTAQDKSAQKK